MILLEQILYDLDRCHSSFKLNNSELTKQRWVAEIIDMSDQIVKLCRVAHNLSPHEQEPIWQGALVVAERLASLEKDYANIPGMVAEYIWLQVKNNPNIGDIFRYRLAFWNNVIN